MAMAVEVSLIILMLAMTVVYMQQLERVRQEIPHWYVDGLWFWLRRGALLGLIGGLLFALTNLPEKIRPEADFLLVSLNLYFISQIVILRGLARR